MNSEEQPSILTVESLSRTYASAGRSLEVLADVSFSLRRGDSCAVVGPSGSGKSTLLALCAGLDAPSRGSVAVCGFDLAGLDEDQRAELRGREIGFIFQSFRLLPTLTALENVMVPAELRRRKDARQSSARLLERVGLKERFTHYPAQLSGGEQQRVAIARAFVNQPSILFADEPTGNLDGATSHAIVELLFGLNRDHGTTLMLVTHDHELAGRAGRTIRLKDGRIQSDQPNSQALGA